MDQASIGGQPAHSKISFTAKLVAYSRSFSDIPFARDVAEAVGAAAVHQEVMDHAGAGGPHSIAWMPPMLEARYKSLSHAIERAGITQVLEFASGVSLRGLAMAQRPSITYVETDLPEMTAEKIALVDKMRQKYRIPDHGNLFFAAVNILDWHEVEAALAHFDTSKKIAVIHEGLLPYLTMGEKATAADNIHKALTRFGGLWITPDFNAKNDAEFHNLATGPMRELGRAIAGATQRDFADNLFTDAAAIAAFAAAHNFKLAVAPQIDGSFALTSFRDADGSPVTMAALTDGLKLWELSAV